MGLADNIAITALVVSLIALLLAGIQLIQQLFLTADGYRRCAKEIIGPFAAKRRLAFVGSELRLQTKYTTPDIIIASEARLRALRISGRNLCRVAGDDYEVKILWQYNDTVHPPTGKGKKFPPQTFLQLIRALGMPLDVEMQQVPGPSLTKAPKEVITRTKTTLDASHAKNDLLVSWIQLLRGLHATYTWYWPLSCTDECLKSRGAEGRYNRSFDEFDRGRSHAAIVYIERSWDFMPPDLLKPLATSTLGSIVVLAIRLGMRWRTLDPGNSKLLADGNGYIFSINDTKGLGIILNFNAFGEHAAPPPYIPSKPTEKPMLGIVPGDRTLVKQDFEILTPASMQIGALTLAPMLSKWFVESSVIARVQGNDYVEAHNEAIILTCPYLPLEECPTWKTHSSLFKDGVRSVFTYWEGRFELHRRLGDYMQSRTGQLPSDALQKVEQKWTALERDFPHDYFSRWRQSVLNAGRIDGSVATDLEIQKSEQSARAKLHTYLRDIHDWTTTWLREHQWNLNDGNNNTRYSRLIAMHVALAVEAFDTAQKEVEATKKAYAGKSQRRWMHERYSLHGIEYYGFVQEVYETAREYVRALPTYAEGLALVLNPEYSSDPGDPPVKPKSDQILTVHDIEEAWWVMMLRGVVWGMSVWNDPLEQPIPSWIYDNQTPVWIA